MTAHAPVADAEQGAVGALAEHGRLLASMDNYKALRIAPTTQSVCLALSTPQSGVHLRIMRTVGANLALVLALDGGGHEHPLRRHAPAPGLQPLRCHRCPPIHRSAITASRSAFRHPRGRPPTQGRAGAARRRPAASAAPGRPREARSPPPRPVLGAHRTVPGGYAQG